MEYCGKGNSYTGEFDGFQLVRKSFLDEIIRKDQPNGFLTPKGKWRLYYF